MMRMHRNRERGVALPMAMMTLMLLTTLMLAFAVLSQTEPVIAANQLRVAQARALADSGFERAVWALTNSTNADGLASPLPGTLPANYNGTTLVALTGGAVSLGGFIVQVEADPAGDPDVRQITSTGWTPTNASTDIRTKAHRRIRAKVNIIPNLAFQAPCALCVKGALSVGGNSTINGTNNDTNCGPNNKYGTFTKDATTTGGSASVTGGAGGVAQNQPASAFDAFTFRSNAMNALKELAKKNGTYYGPGYPNGGTSPTSGSYDCRNVTFNSGHQVNNGIVFVDTCDGTNPTASTPTSNIAAVDIHGNPFTGLPGAATGSPTSTDPSDAFTGWLVVNGSLSISGNMQMKGLVYAANDLTYNGTGTGGIFGLAVSQNIIDTNATSIDSDTKGNSLINFNCQNVTNLPTIPPSFNLIAGTYRECTDTTCP
jgi:hypothetical protein